MVYVVKPNVQLMVLVQIVHRVRKNTVIPVVALMIRLVYVKLILKMKDVDVLMEVCLLNIIMLAVKMVLYIQSLFWAKVIPL
jgi:hypothetical protein